MIRINVVLLFNPCYTRPKFMCSEMAQVHDNRFGSMEDPIDCVQTDFSAEIHRVKGMLSRMEASMGAY